MQVANWKVYRIDYDTLTEDGRIKTNYKASLLGLSHEDCIRYVQRVMGKIRINTIGVESELHAITDGMVTKLRDILDLKLSRVEETPPESKKLNPIKPKRGWTEEQRKKYREAIALRNAEKK